jgi:hypothetical protein
MVFGVSRDHFFVDDRHRPNIAVVRKSDTVSLCRTDPARSNRRTSSRASTSQSQTANSRPTTLSFRRRIGWCRFRCRAHSPIRRSDPMCNAWERRTARTREGWYVYQAEPAASANRPLPLPFFSGSVLSCVLKPEAEAWPGSIDAGGVACIGGNSAPTHARRAVSLTYSPVNSVVFHPGFPSIASTGAVLTPATENTR